MSEFLGTVLIIIVLWFGGILILHNDNTITVSSFIFYLVILYSLINPLKEFSKASYNIPKGLASMERVDKILKAENKIKINPYPVHIGMFTDRIEFRHVSFKYENQWVLRDINLNIPKGKTIALVGQSGSGKSTLVDLIPRFHDVQEGTVLIDGIDIKDTTLFELRSMMGNVNQEAILFNDTFYNNIAFGVENATAQQVIGAAKIANAHEFIMASERGYDTVISDRGKKLSSGQQQRISKLLYILASWAIFLSS